jgi:hypothetical protein
VIVADFFLVELRSLDLDLVWFGWVWFDKEPYHFHHLQKKSVVLAVNAQHHGIDGMDSSTCTRLVLFSQFRVVNITNHTYQSA